MMKSLSNPTAQTAFGKSRPEIELMLACASTRLDSGRTERIKALLQGEIDWAYTLRAALAHSVMPLLYRSLNTACAENVPQAVLKQLQSYYHANAAHNLLLADELLKILRLFDANKIPAIPYKGPVLAASVYGDLSLRQFGDLDILIQKRDAVQAKNLLSSQGYRLWDPRLDGLLPAFYRIRKVYELASADRQLLVELHWSVAAWPVRFPLDSAELWKEVETVTLAGASVRSLKPEDLLLILCVHGSKHLWCRLGWICDIAELLRTYPGLAWEDLLARAERLGGARMLLLGLLLANELLGADLVDLVKRRLREEGVVAQFAAQVRAQLYSAATESSSAVDWPAFYLNLRERRRDQVPCVVFLTYRAIRKGIARILPPSIHSGSKFGKKVA
jgi:hypothetical protein